MGGFWDVAVFGGGRGLTKMLGMTLMDSDTYSSNSFPKALSLKLRFVLLSVLEDIFKVVEVIGGEWGSSATHFFRSSLVWPLILALSSSTHFFLWQLFFLQPRVLLFIFFLISIRPLSAFFCSTIVCFAACLSFSSFSCNSFTLLIFRNSFCSVQRGRHIRRFYSFGWIRGSSSCQNILIRFRHTHTHKLVVP